MEPQPSTVALCHAARALLVTSLVLPSLYMAIRLASTLNVALWKRRSFRFVVTSLLLSLVETAVPSCGCSQVSGRALFRHFSDPTVTKRPPALLVESNLIIVITSRTVAA